MVLRARQILLALIVPLLVVFAIAPAMAQGTGYGTPARSLSPLTLLDGPGTRYPVVGAIAADVAVTVYRCTVMWCNVEQGRNAGWIQIRKLNFGISPADRFPSPRFGYAHGGPGEVCFFEGRNYTGASVCIGPGKILNDLKLAHLDNRFSSVSLTGNVSAAVCRDSDFQSYCTRIVASQPALNKHLDNNVSSIRVY